MSSPSKRRDMDVMKLMMGDYKVEPINDGINEFNVEFHGPKDSLYVGGVWKVHVELPDSYPYKSPSIGFLNKIYHPNVDEGSCRGLVCGGVQPAVGILTTFIAILGHLESEFHEAYLLNIFETFLPQLLLYPNPSDPLNGDAASLMLRDKQQYEQKVKEYCERFAKENTANASAEESSDEDVSDGNGVASSDDDVAGHADP
ncbi:hypothetical protein Sjap_008194 [Stephania japonica]|uniref:Ubiquitin-conjugating enzyme E2 H n=1 Tax=Stephania japonica TaxID=461633 RepID=A0AAP0JPV4_9MAGN